MNSLELVTRLADMRGVSGRESSVARQVCAALKPFAADAVCRDGSVLAHIQPVKNPDKPTLLLCAHLDQVGFFVTDITEDGFLRIGNVGGIDRRLLLGQPVTIMGKTPLFGVISILPPHLLQGEQAVPDMQKLCVDTGFSSADALKDKVRRGDAVYFHTTCQPLLNDCLTGSALDDRCGVAALILAAQQLSECPDLPCNVTILCSAQEERGGRGAKTLPRLEQPDYAIAVDVTFAESENDRGCECFKLDGGPAIGFSSVLDATFSDALCLAATCANIPYQIEVMPETTGTDADALAFAADGGTKAATVSIPLRNMHTPVEIISLRDVEQTAALLVAYAKECRI